jgi:hypothetical protein
MSLLTGRRYANLCHLIAEGLDHRTAEVREAGSPFGWEVGVYALGHSHPALGQFDVDYVGSAYRPGGDVADRVREHLRDESKAEAFGGQVLFALRRDLAVEEVRRLEGVIARALGVPHWCQRIPGGRSLPARVGR